MNMINMSTGFSNFQLHLGRSLCIIPPLVPNTLPPNVCSVAAQAENLLTELTLDINKAQDNLLTAKAYQAHSKNTCHAPKVIYNVSDHVMLSTLHRHKEYWKKGDECAAKLFPQWDSPYTITHTCPESSNCTLNMKGHNLIYPTYHASELKHHVPNNPLLFPNHDHPWSGPVLTPNGLEEHKIEAIIDSRRRGWGYQLLVRWLGFGPEDNEWLPFSMVKDCEALNRWYNQLETTVLTLPKDLLLNKVAFDWAHFNFKSTLLHKSISISHHQH